MSSLVTAKRPDLSWTEGQLELSAAGYEWFFELITGT